MSIIFFALGGSGGHIFPAEAVIKKLDKKHIIILSYDARSSELIKGILLEKKSLVLNINMSSSKFIRKTINYLKLFFYTLKFIKFFIKNRPRIIVAFGSYSIIPPCVAGIILRIPIFLHEQNVILGKANKLISPFAKKLFTSFEKINSSQVTGLPVRIKKTTKKYSTKFCILAIGGSQGAQLLSKIIPEAISLLNKENQAKIEIAQQVRKEDMARVKKIYKKTSCYSTVKTFFENIDSLYAKSDLIICRAGASSIAEILCFQKSAIIVPIKFSSHNHQYLNAKYVTSKANIILKEEKNFNSRWLATQLEKFLENRNITKKIEKSFPHHLKSLHMNASETIKKEIENFINNQSSKRISS